MRCGCEIPKEVQEGVQMHSRTAKAIFLRFEGRANVNIRNNPIFLSEHEGKNDWISAGTHLSGRAIEINDKDYGLIFTLSSSNCNHV